MSTFVARWPILDPDVPQDRLKAQALADLPAMRPRGMALHGKQWEFTEDELILTADARPAIGNAAKTALTHCPANHEFTPENLVTDHKGGRRCRACKAEQNKRRSAKRRAERATTSINHRRDLNMMKLPAGPLLEVAAGKELSPTNDKALGRARKIGWLYEDVADRIACSLGLHPCLIWPEWFGEAA